MRRLTVFNFITLNGYYKGAGGDISWHRHGAEENEFAADSLQGDSILLFGRVTYEMMAGYWPSEEAIKNNPQVAAGMNSAEKIVFSRTLQTAGWNNTTLVKEDIAEEVRRLKQLPGKDLTILGSGSIVTQFSEIGLIDEYQFMIDPVVIAGGTPIFNGITHKLDLALTTTKTFKSGVVLHCYRPLKERQ